MISAGIDYNSAGNGEPVIFMHGIGGGDATFNAQLIELENYACFAWNMPGYADSETTQWPPSFASLSDALANFIDSLGFEKVHLVGQSIGGMLALEHAVRQPQQVATLTLIACTPRFGGQDDNFKDAFLKARLSPLDSGKSMAEVASISAPKLVGPAANADVIYEVESILSTISEKTWRGVLECLVTFNRRDDLASISQPCCVIAGEFDLNAPAKTMAKMSKTLPNAQYHLIEQVGHMINQEAPEKTNQLINSFLLQHPL